ncbi:hypothetical protein [Geminicoccus roseus]|uniref:hypothetical protein n=1 Tax=Geminicoccus roseus TaxID=404900 RepID=UPI00040BF352|nr:hypothetical protein [Geminicoccus roseus]
MSLATRPAIFLVIAAGYTIWSVALGALYGALSVGCEFGWQDMALGPLSLQRAVLLALWIASVAVLVLLSWQSWTWWRQSDPEAPKLVRFGVWLSAAASISAAAATFWMGLPILALSTCT